MSPNPGALSERGATVLLTGLPGAGKSTIALALQRQLREGGQAAYVLDGDSLRQGLSADLGFSPAARDEHIRRVGHVAQLFADAGLVAVLSVIAPFAAARQRLRQAHLTAQLPFVEVFVDTSLEECERRDPKGLYARARAGTLTGFTGVDAAYERPERPEVHVRTSTTGVDQAVALIVAALRGGGG